jgi:hypothetical protein
VISTAVKLKDGFYGMIHKLAAIFTHAGKAVHLRGILFSRNVFLAARAKILREHPMAFVYELGRA